MNTMVSIAIGVVFIFLVFSLVISGVNEGVVALTSTRAKVLWTTLRQFASNEGTGGRQSQLTLRQVVMFPTKVFSKDSRPKQTESSHVDHVGGNNFLNNVLAQTNRFESGKRRSRLKNVSPKVISRALLELGGDLTELTHATVTNVDDFLQKVLDRVKGSQLERPVKAAIAEARGDVERFRAEIESWFDARMHALSSLYKMWSRWILLGLALVLAFVVDVNPIVAVDLLRKDSALAQATVDQATQFASSQNLTLAGCSTGDGSATPATNEATLGTCYKSIQAEFARTRSFPPPLSFDHWFKGDEKTWQYLIGCLLGAIAISFGAPFWFDVLRRLIATRK